MLYWSSCCLLINLPELSWFVNADLHTKDRRVPFETSRSSYIRKLDGLRQTRNLRFKNGLHWQPPPAAKESPCWPRLPYFF